MATQAVEPLNAEVGTAAISERTGVLPLHFRKVFAGALRTPNERLHRGTSLGGTACLWQGYGSFPACAATGVTNKAFNGR